MDSFIELLNYKSNLAKVAEKWFFKYNTRVLSYEELMEFKEDQEKHNLEAKDVNECMYDLYIEYLENLLQENNINYKECNNMDKDKLKEKIENKVSEALAKLRKKSEEIEEVIDPLLKTEGECKVNPEVNLVKEEPKGMEVENDDLEELMNYLDELGVEYQVIGTDEPLKVVEEEEEKLVEPFMLLEDDEPSVRLRSEDIEYKIPEYVETEDLLIPINEVELDEEEIEELEEIADDIEPIELGRVLPCVVNGEDKYLKDGINCNFMDIPLLGLTLVSPINLTVDVLYIDPNAESLDDIAILAIAHNNSSTGGFGCETTIGALRKLGLLELTTTYDLELDLTPLAYRGLTIEVNEKELEDLID